MQSSLPRDRPLVVLSPSGSKVCPPLPISPIVGSPAVYIPALRLTTSIVTGCRGVPREQRLRAWLVPQDHKMAENDDCAVVGVQSILDVLSQRLRQSEVLDLSQSDDDDSRYSDAQPVPKVVVKPEPMDHDDELASTYGSGKRSTSASRPKTKLKGTATNPRRKRQRRVPPKAAQRPAKRDRRTLHYDDDDNDFEDEEEEEWVDSADDKDAEWMDDEDAEWMDDDDDADDGAAGVYRVIPKTKHSPQKRQSKGSSNSKGSRSKGSINSTLLNGSKNGSTSKGNSKSPSEQSGSATVPMVPELEPVNCSVCHDRMPGICKACKSAVMQRRLAIQMRKSEKSKSAKAAKPKKAAAPCGVCHGRLKGLCLACRE